MKKISSILSIWLVLLFAGQSLYGLSVDNTLQNREAAIQPVAQSDDTGSYPPAAVVLSSASSAEVILTNNNSTPQPFGEEESKRDKYRLGAQGIGYSKSVNSQIGNTQIIERHFTFREIIYPYHYHW